MSSQYMIVYVTMSNREAVDQDFQNIKLGNSKHFKYILFQNTLSEMKIYSIHINKLNNVLVKYELINNTSILNEVKY